MNTYEIIKDLAKRKKISIRQLEINFGYSNGTVFPFDGKEISKETMRKAIAIAKALEENE